MNAHSAGTARKLIARLELFKVVHVNELRLRVIADSRLILQSCAILSVVCGVIRARCAFASAGWSRCSPREQHQYDGNNTFTTFSPPPC